MIERIALRNIKCFDSIDFPCARLTVLTGRNGAGKSTIIQALLLVQQSIQQGKLPTVGLALNGDLVRIGNAKDLLCEFASSDDLGISISDSTESWDLRFGYDRAADVLRLVSDAGNERTNLVPLWPAFMQYLNAERIGPRAYSESSDFMVRTLRQLGTQGEYTVHYLHEYRDMPVDRTAMLIGDAASARLFDQAEAWLRLVIPGIRINSVLQAQMDVLALTYAFEGPGGLGNPYRPTNVGFGVSYVLPIIVACLSLPVGGMLIVENPEAHLHPAAQATIARLLALTASSGVQVIVETHSDHIINGLRIAVKSQAVLPDDVAIMYIESPAVTGGKHFTRLHVDASGRMSDWPPGFFDQWETDLATIISPTMPIF